MTSTYRYAVCLFAGGAKKFLYTGSKKEGSDDEQWTFAPKDSATKTDSTKNGVSQPSERKDVPQWAAARGSSFSYSYNSGHKFNINNDDANSQASSQVSRGYHSNPSPRPRHFNSSTWQADENDF
ncbi:hypothetical protein BaRGS_00020998 [Batillaria attramentaria]|uniref:Uncharacterized protein n=1 Tax=Batillaria attramentaria TaxID=370345 RepID=A0ABD0KL59_9CAEN